MVRRRAGEPASRHRSAATLSAPQKLLITSITDYLTNGGRIKVAQKMAGHVNAKTMGLYDRRNDDIRVGEVERIGI